MKVDVHPADDGGCGHYRLIWPAEQLQDAGFDITIGAKLDCIREANNVLGDRLIDIVVDADVVVFQRPLRPAVVEAIEMLQHKGVAVVVEIDDDFHGLPKGHPAARDFSPQNNPERNWQWLRRACDRADLVTCTTPALAARYAPHGRFAVLPNCVPGRYLRVEGKPNDRPTVGWTGTPITHVGDLDVCGPAIADVQTATGCDFRAIGSRQTLKVLDVDGSYIEWAELTDPGPDGYAHTVASLDVGLVPLADNTFNRSKSALKTIEYAALGVFPVVSPTPDNLRMHAHGLGVVAATPDEWQHHVHHAVVDANSRDEHVARARDSMRSWTYEERSHLWWDAWTAAYANRKGATT